MKKIWWIGTGVMWNSMVQHIIKSWDYEVFVWNRTKEKTDNLVEMGATYIKTIGELAQKCDIVFSIIGDPQNVWDTYFWEQGILNNIASETILVDMTTTKPSLAKDIYKTHNKFLDAPVSGGDVGAQNGTLSIMVWGEEKIYNEIFPLFSLMGNSITYTGEAGNWQHTKMANQISIAGNTIALCESLVYAEKAGLDLEKTIQVVSNGAAWSWGWKNLWPRILRNELDTCFFVKHFVKDMKIALEECQNMQIALPGLALVHQLYMSLVAYNKQDLWTQALIKVIRGINNM